VASPIPEEAPVTSATRVKPLCAFMKYLFLVRERAHNWADMDHGWGQPPGWQAAPGYA